MGESRGGFAPAERIALPLHFLLKVYSVAANTFVEGVRQPVYAILVGVAAALILLSPYLTMYTLMQSPKFMTDMGLATLLLAGLLLGAFTASNVISQEIENRTVLTVISKPVGRVGVHPRQVPRRDGGTGPRELSAFAGAHPHDQRRGAWRRTSSRI